MCTHGSAYEILLLYLFLTLLSANLYDQLLGPRFFCKLVSIYDLEFALENILHNIVSALLLNECG